MTRTVLWKTSWLGREPAETRPSLGSATEPPLLEALRHLPVGKKGHTSRFSFGDEGQVWRLCLPVSMSLGPELGRKWGRFGYVNAPRTVLAPSILNVFVF